MNGLKNGSHVGAVLQSIIQEQGTQICSSKQRLEGFLKDLCGDQRLEINLLLFALQEQIVHQLMHAGTMETSQPLFGQRLVQQLQDHTGIQTDYAVWAVETWAAALGKKVSFNASSTSPVSRKQPNLETPKRPVHTPRKLLLYKGIQKDVFETEGDLQRRVQRNGRLRLGEGRLIRERYDVQTGKFPLLIHWNSSVPEWIGDPAAFQKLIADLRSYKTIKDAELLAILDSKQKFGDLSTVKVIDQIRRHCKSKSIGSWQFLRDFMKSGGSVDSQGSTIEYWVEVPRDVARTLFDRGPQYPVLADLQVEEGKVWIDTLYLNAHGAPMPIHFTPAKNRHLRYCSRCGRGYQPPTNWCVSCSRELV